MLKVAALQRSESIDVKKSPLFFQTTEKSSWKNPSKKSDVIYLEKMLFLEAEKLSTPPKTNMTTENFQTVWRRISPIKNCDFPACHFIFSGVCENVDMEIQNLVPFSRD